MIVCNVSPGESLGGLDLLLRRPPRRALLSGAGRSSSASAPRRWCRTSRASLARRYWVNWRSKPWRCIPTAPSPMPGQESSQARTDQRARSYDSYARVRVLLRQVRPGSDAHLDDQPAREGTDQVPRVRWQGPTATAQCVHVSDIEEVLI